MGLNLRPLRVCGLILLSGLIWYSMRTWRNEIDGVRVSDSNLDTGLCSLYPDLGDIAVILKTGATETTRKLAATLRTSLQCVKDPIVLSDLEQVINGIQVHDVLARISPEVIYANQEFDIYREQQRLQSQGREHELESLSGIPAAPRDWRTKGRSAAWALDKYKWYVFVETDTYVSWPNLKRWLGTMDPNEQLYLGLAIRKSDDREPFYFAQGGSGLVLSGAALKEFAEVRNGTASRYDSRVSDWWAGDFLIADCLWDEMHLPVTQVLPLFNELEPQSLPMWEHAWCQASITMHHMKSEDFDQILQLEKSLNFSRLLIQDVYQVAYPQGLPARLDDWDNGADAREHALSMNEYHFQLEPDLNFESCRAACEEVAPCLQFTWRNFTVRNGDNGANIDSLASCILSRAIRLGHTKPEQAFEQELAEPNTYRRWHSGWLQGRIAQWVSTHADCKEADKYRTGDWEDASGW